MRRAFAISALLFACAVLARGAQASDLSALDLSGEWYVLVHFRDDRSEEASIEKFDDFAWSIQHSDGKLRLKNFPYVMFTEEQERVRREAMRQHRHWAPTPGMWGRIQKSIKVSSRAASTKTLRGSRGQSYESLPPMGGGSANTISFTRDWKISFSPERIEIRITDSLSGGMGMEGMEDSIFYVVTEQAADGDLRGTYREPHKKGTFRMVRSAKRGAAD